MRSPLFGPLSQHHFVDGLLGGQEVYSIDLTIQGDGLEEFFLTDQRLDLILAPGRPPLVARQPDGLLQLVAFPKPLK